jgi:hypothetical protein
MNVYVDSRKVIPANTSECPNPLLNLKMFWTYGRLHRKPNAAQNIPTASLTHADGISALTAMATPAEKKIVHKY